MAFKFNAILKFNGDAATAQLDKAGKGFKRLQGGIKKASASMGKMAAGMKSIGIAGSAMTAGVGFATKTYADFEFQMKTVQSVLLATDEEMTSLNNTTKLLGATTEFSAKQAGEGAEALARAGLTTKQIIGALPGVLAAASAGGVGLAEATDIVVGQLGAFGLKAAQAGDVADSLALTTALTNTNFTQLGEAMKFAAPIAKNAGMSLQSTATAMGVLANAGVKGSLAGTALKNALLKLAKPSKKAVDLFGGKGGFNEAVMETVKVNGKLVTRLRPMEVIMANVSKVVAKAKNPLEATATASEIFGLRGTTAFSSFQAALTKTIPITEKNREAIMRGAKAAGENIDKYIAKGAIPKLVALRFQIAGATGTSQKMRDIKLNSLTGQVTLLKSAFEGINIELGGVFAGVTKNLVGKATDFLSVLVVGFQAAKAGGKATEAQLKSLSNNQFGGLVQDAIEFASGFIEGFKEIKAAAIDTFKTVSNFLKPILGDTNMTTKELGKLVAKIITVGAVVGPVILGIAAAAFVLGPVIGAITGAFTFLASTISILWGVAQVVFGAIGAVVAGVSLPVLAIIAAVVAVGAAFYFFWDEIKAGFNWMVNFIAEKMQPIFTIFRFLGAVVQVIFTEITSYVSGWAIKFMELISPIGVFISDMFDVAVEKIVGAFNTIIEFITPFAVKVKDIFVAIGKSIFDAITFPFRMMIGFVQSMLSKLAGSFLGKKALSLAGIDPKTFQDSLKGISVPTKTEVATLKEPPKDLQKSNEVQAQSAKITAESVKQKAVSQPASANQISEAVVKTQAASQSGGGTSTGGGTSKQVIELKFKGDAGKVLNKIVTKGQVEQSLLNGKTVPNKRKLLQNGASAIAGAF